MSDNPADAVRIPISVEANFEAARAQSEELERAIDKMAQSAVAGFNQVRGAVQGLVRDYEHLNRVASQYTPPQFAAAYPQTAGQMSQVRTAQATVQRAVTNGIPLTPQQQATITGGAAPAGPSASPSQQAKEDKRREAEYLAAERAGKKLEQQQFQAEQRTQRRQEAEDRKRQRDEDRAQKQQERADKQREAASTRAAVEHSTLQARTLSGMGALATGNAGPLARTFAHQLLIAMSGVTPGSMPGGSIGMAAARFVGGGALMASGAMGGGISSGAGGLASGAGAAAIGAAGVAGIITAAIGALLLGGNIENADTERKAQLLRASIPGLGYNAGTQMTLGAVRAAAAYHYDQQVGVDVASTLGVAGVRQNQILPATNAAMAVSRQTMLDPMEITRIMSTLMVQGGQSVQSVVKSFQELEQQAKKTGIPLNRMVDSLQAFQTATGGASINMNALSAIQGIAGPGINAGSLIAPLAGATGASALQAAAFLGVSPGLLQSLQFGGPGGQGNQAKLMDLVQARVQGMFGRHPSAGQMDVAEAVLGNFLNLQNIPVQQQAKLMNTLFTGKPGQFSAEMEKITKGEKIVSTQDFEQQMLGEAGRQTDVLHQILDEIQKDWRQLAADLNWLGPIASTLGNIWGGINSLVMHFMGPSNKTGGAFSSPVDLGNAVRRQVAQWLDPTGQHTGPHGVPLPNAPADTLVPGTHFLGGRYGTRTGTVPQTQFNTFGLVPNASGSPNKMPAWMWPMVQHAAKITGMDPIMLAAQLSIESGFDPNAKSKAGAIGVAQFMPDTARAVWKEMGMKGTPDLRNPAQEIMMQAYLDRSNKTSKNTWAQALERYNPGDPNYGQTVVNVETNLHGQIELVDANGRVLGVLYPSNVKVSHKVDHTRKPGGHRTHAPAKTPPPPPPRHTPIIPH